MNFFSITFALAALAALANVDAAKLFSRGRPHGKHGILGLPKHDDLLEESKFDEHWFDQKLDHFDPASTARWKQVSLSIFEFPDGFL